MARVGGGDGAVRILIAGGGTGGHLIPSINLARELAGREPEPDVLLVGGVRGPDRQLLTTSGFAHRHIDAPALDRARPHRNARLPWRLVRAVREARRIVREFAPSAVIGTGGYVSVPIGLAARLERIPLVLQEQNREPGVATRLLGRWAERVCVAYPELADRAVGNAEVTLTGNPIAPLEPAEAPFQARLDATRPTLGVFGGSQGAAAINTAVIACFRDRIDTMPNVIWQTGEIDLDRVRTGFAWPDRVVIEPFFTPMAAVYPRLDLIVCRSGAMTLAELAAWRLPSILIPYPHATADHQTTNARAFETAGAAVVVPEADLDGRRLDNVVHGLLADAAARDRMADAAAGLARPNAARDIVDLVLDTTRASAR